MPPNTDGDQPRRWLTLIAMTGSLSMIFIDITVVGVALPQIRNDLGMSEASLQWVVSVYTLVMACLVALGGRAADRFGRVPVFLSGVAAFALASIACGMATSAESLIVARGVQGATAALMQPASAALVIGAFAPGSRGKAMAVYVGIPMLFMVVGPLVGGAITETASWRWCFWVNVPVALVAMALTALARPIDRRRDVGPIDPLAAVLLLLGLPVLILAIQQGNEWGWTTPWLAEAAGHFAPLGAVSGLPLLVVGASLMALFVRSQWRSARPLLALSLFRDRGLLANGLTIFLMQFSMSGLLIQGSVYAQEVLGYDAMQAGASMLPLLVPVLLVVHVAGRVYDRVGVRTPALLGSLLASLGGAMAAMGAWRQNPWIIGSGFTVMGVGIGFVMSPTNTDSLSRVGDESRAQISGLVQTMRLVGGTAGLAIIGATVLTLSERLGGTRSEAFAKAVACGYLVGAAACAGAALAIARLHERERGAAGVL